MWGKIKKIVSDLLMLDDRKKYERYLSTASDIHELERMQKDLERKGFNF